MVLSFGFSIGDGGIFQCGNSESTRSEPQCDVQDAFSPEKKGSSRAPLVRELGCRVVGHILIRHQQPRRGCEGKSQKEGGGGGLELTWVKKMRREKGSISGVRGPLMYACMCRHEGPHPEKKGRQVEKEGLASDIQSFALGRLHWDAC